MVESYTREAGVRNLERQIANVCRKIAKDIAVGTTKKVSISRKNVSSYLGPEKFLPELAERNNKPGIVIGLAWTAFGGDILFIEATKMNYFPVNLFRKIFCKLFENNAKSLRIYYNNYF